MKWCLVFLANQLQAHGKYVKLPRPYQRFLQLIARAKHLLMTTIAPCGDHKATAFVPMKGLRITDDLGSGINVAPDLRLVNNPSALSEKLTRGLVEGIGIIDANYLRSCPTVLVFDGSAYLPEFPRDGTEHVFLRSILARAGFLCFSLWLHRSHAIHADEAFLQWRSKTGVYMSRVSGGDRTYLPDGSFDADSKYSAQEVRESRDICRTWLDKPGAFTFPTHPKHPHSTTPDVPRIDRFRMAASSAMREFELSRRIALWVSALESLLSSGSSELTHRLSERAAVCAAHSGKERVDLYNVVKSAYRIRSAVMHGDKIPKKTYGDIPALSVALEDIVRKSFMSVLADGELSQALFSDESDRIDSIFLDRLLSN